MRATGTVNFFSGLARFIVALTLSALPVGAQSATEITVPAEKLECLLENRERYLELPRAAFPFAPMECPTVEVDLSRLSLNTDSEVDAPTLTYILRRDFECLIAHIEDYMVEHSQSATDGTITFALDCQG